MRRLRWWLFLLRYRIARWRGKVWATGMLRPEFIFEYRSRAHTFGPEIERLLGEHANHD